MKKFIAPLLMSSALLATGCTAVNQLMPTALGSAQQLSLAPGQVWKGTYTCAQGLTNMQLHIQQVQGQRFSGIWYFNQHNNFTGSVNFTGYTNQNELVLKATSWNQMPQGGGILVNINGVYNPQSKIISGYVYTQEGPNTCSTFNVSQ